MHQHCMTLDSVRITQREGLLRRLPHGAQGARREELLTGIRREELKRAPDAVSRRLLKAVCPPRQTRQEGLGFAPSSYRPRVWSPGEAIVRAEIARSC
jgi:hypothetical protein